MEFRSVEEIFAHLDRTRGELVDRVSSLNAEQADFQPSPEKWSARMIVEHLAKTEESLSRAIEKMLAKAEAENAAASTGAIEPPVSFAEIAAKAQGMKFEAPDMIRPSGAATVSESLSRL